MKDDLDEDIPGTRSSIESAATRFHITFFFVMSMIGSVLFLIGYFQMAPNQLRNVPEPIIFICVGIGGFGFFFPWFVGLYFARHFLHTVRDLEQRIDRLEKPEKPPKDNSPWQDDTEIV